MSGCLSTEAVKFDPFGKMASIKDSNVIQNKRNKNHGAYQIAFPAGLGVRPPLSAVPVHSVCLNTSRHKVFTTRMAGRGVLQFPRSLGHSMDHRMGSPRSGPISARLHGSEERPWALHAGAADCSPALWLWLRTALGRRDDPLVYGRKQAPHPSPRPRSPQKRLDILCRGVSAGAGPENRSWDVALAGPGNAVNPGRLALDRGTPGGLGQLDTSIAENKAAERKVMTSTSLSC